MKMLSLVLVDKYVPPGSVERCVGHFLFVSAAEGGDIPPGMGVTENTIMPPPSSICPQETL